MSSNRKGVRRSPPLQCDAVGPDDGVDPKVLFRSSERRRDDAHVRRLCSQAREALTFALAGSCRDASLQSLHVAEVRPAPDASRLEVVLVALDAAEAAAARARLPFVAALLRAEVAASVRRRRAPELVFRVVADGEVRP